MYQNSNLNTGRRGLNILKPRAKQTAAIHWLAYNFLEHTSRSSSDEQGEVDEDKVHGHGVKRRKHFGIYDQLMGEHRREDPKAFKDFLRMPPEMLDEIFARIEDCLTKQYTWYREHLEPGLKVKAVSFSQLSTSKGPSSQGPSPQWPSWSVHPPQLMTVKENWHKTMRQVGLCSFSIRRGLDSSPGQVWQHHTMLRAFSHCMPSFVYIEQIVSVFSWSILGNSIVYCLHKSHMDTCTTTKCENGHKCGIILPYM